MQVTPSDVVMEPSEIQTFDAAVLHASDDRVEWTLPAGFSEIGQENFGKTIIIQAPPAEANWNTPVSLRARSQANTGSRNGEVDSDPRDGFALIRPKNGRIVVSPDGICIHPGESSTFTAKVTGLDNKQVTWMASAGGFVGDIYTAPPSAVPDVLITATSVDDPRPRARRTSRSATAVAIGMRPSRGRRRRIQRLVCYMGLVRPERHRPAAKRGRTLSIDSHRDVRRVQGTGEYKANVSSIIISDRDDAYTAFDLPEVECHSDPDHHDPRRHSHGGVPGWTTGPDRAGQPSDLEHHYGQHQLPGGERPHGISVLRCP